VPTALNFGPPPDHAGARDVGWLVETATAALRRHGIAAADWQQDGDPGPVEAAMLSLDPAAARETLGWQTRLDATTAAAWTAEWHARLQQGADARTLVFDQLDRFAATADSAARVA